MFRKLNVLAIAVGLAGLAGACGVKDEGRGTAEVPRGLGKADSQYSCQGICGAQAPGGCWCDDQCAQFGDCCPDKVQLCDQQQPSCAGHCGGKSPEGCWCDEQCARYGDCCPDKKEQCDAGPATCTKDADCAANEFCGYKEGECLLQTFAILQGTCAVKPEACTMQYDPVCGCDGKTYGNACSAASAGVSVASKGECQDPCWGAWVDDSGACRGPADGVLPDSCCTEEKQQLCSAIDQKYGAAVQAAKECVPWPTFAPQCTVLVATSLVSCSATCSTYINGSPATLSSFVEQWKQLQCDALPWICAAYICPLPSGGGCAAQDGGGHACVDFHE